MGRIYVKTWKGIHGIKPTTTTTRKKFILEELPNSSETENMRKIR